MLITTAWVRSSFMFRRTSSFLPNNISSIPSRSLSSTRRLSSQTVFPRMSSLKVAVIGCSHGAIDEIFSAIKEIEKNNNSSIDLIICPGDFQAIRNQNDLQCMACPPKYRHMGTFWKYYAGHSVANIPIIFVGGNHEASNHLQEMPLGGLVAPNMYYLGEAGVVNYRGLRIAGLTGVYVSHNYEKQRFESPPYPKSQIRSVYHARKTDVDRLLRLKPSVDLFISHDWPRGIWNHGDLDKLLAAKPFLRKEISENTLGNPGTQLLLQHLKPNYWFAAHMHVHFPALVKHPNSNQVTRFLALDKILPRRDFIQILHIPVQHGQDEQNNNELDEFNIQLDMEWLTILRTQTKNPSRYSSVTDEEIEETRQLLEKNSVPAYVRPISDFHVSVPIHDGKQTRGSVPQQLTLQPHTKALMDALEIGDITNSLTERTDSLQAIV